MLVRGAVIGLVLACCMATAALPAFGSPNGSSDSSSDGRAKALFTIHDQRITESSGLAASTIHPGVVYTINDSDNEPRIYALDRDGNVVASLLMRLVYNRDWEAIATGPHKRVWVGDIGDNGENQSSITLYRFREPDPLEDQRLYWSRYRLEYEDGPHNAETLLVHPKTGQIYIVTKDSGGGGIYEAPNPLSADATSTLHRIGDAPARVTDGTFLPDGSGIVLRTYTKAYVLGWPSGKVRRTISLPSQPQGESVTTAKDGKRILVGSEGRGSQVFSVPLAPPKKPSPTPTPTRTVTGQASATPQASASPTIVGPGGTDPNALIAGLPWWVPALALAVAILAGVAAFPRRLARSNRDR